MLKAISQADILSTQNKKKCIDQLTVHNMMGSKPCTPNTEYSKCLSGQMYVSEMQEGEMSV